MTTSPVMSVTDELVAELERAARSALQGGSEWYGEGCCLYSYLESSDANFMVAASPALIGALLAERAELKSDVAEYAKAFNKMAGKIAALAIPTGEVKDTNNLDDLLAWFGRVMTERAELKRDTGRYRFARHNDNDCFMLNTLQRVSGDELDAAIDAAMQAQQHREPHADDAAHMEIDTDSIANHKALP